MKYLLVVIEPLDTGHPDRDAIVSSGFAEAFDKAVPPKTDIKKPLRNVWLLPLEQGLRTISTLRAKSPSTEGRFAAIVLDSAPDIVVLP